MYCVSLSSSCATATPVKPDSSIAAVHAATGRHWFTLMDDSRSVVRVVCDVFDQADGVFLDAAVRHRNVVEGGAREARRGGADARLAMADAPFRRHDHDICPSRDLRGCEGHR